MIKAIETSYAGCRFRSRLEAKYAVLFNELGIRWQYEAEGYVLGDGTWYLPDFWLPDLEMHAEVKGATMTDREIRTAYHAAACLPHDGKYLMLGPIPPGKDDVSDPFHADYRKDWTTGHPLLRREDDGVHYRLGYFTKPERGRGGFVIDDSPYNMRHNLFSLARVYETNVAEPASMYPRVGNFSDVAKAYDKARSARFEHGQTGGFNVS